MQASRIDRILWSLVAGSLLVGVVWIGANVFVIHRHRQAARKMEVALLRLSETVPAGLTEDQWAFCLLRTWNLHSNYGDYPYVPVADLQRIERALHSRIDAGANLTTIDWIWDEYLRACPRAVHYDRYRPTAPDNKDEFDMGAHGNNPLSEWRDRHRRGSE